MQQKIEQIALYIFLGFLKAGVLEDSYFYTCINVNVDGRIKPLVITGNAHPKVEDGYIIAVLNPDKDLIDEINFRNAPNLLGRHDVVEKRCDLMVSLWVDAYKKDMIGGRNVYKARKATPAKFNLRQGSDPGHAHYVEYLHSSSPKKH